jgi:hypothetical protein
LHLQGTVTVHHQNVRHKLHVAGERTHIQNADGGVIIDTKLKQKKNNNDNWSRVVAGGGSTHHGTIEEEGDEGAGLAMSRSIGDVDFANAGVIPIRM